MLLKLSGIYEGEYHLVNPDQIKFVLNDGFYADNKHRKTLRICFGNEQYVTIANDDGGMMDGLMLVANGSYNLVYADWLEERGFTEAAEALREFNR
jgi:hypothetical protein